MDKPMTQFELCRELNLQGFPVKKNDTALYYIRPDMLISMRDFDVLQGENKKPYGFPAHDSAPGNSLFDQLIYKPEIEDFVEYLGSDLQQVTQTNGSGWFAYANSTLGAGITTRSGGETMWLALANVVYARFLEKTQKFPLMDASDSENTQEGQEPPQMPEGITPLENENN